MLIKYLAYIITQFPVFLFTRFISNLISFYKNLLLEIDNRYQFELNIRMFFVPLYGDTNWALRFIGVMYRLTKLIFGLIFLVVFTFVYAAAAFSFLLAIPASILYSIEAFIFVLLTYFLIYTIYFIIFPFEKLTYEKNYYTLFEVYKMSNFRARNTLSSLLSKKDLPKLYKEISEYLELDSKVVSEFVNKADYKNTKSIASTVISFGILVGYRYVDSSLLLSAFLNFNFEWNSFLTLQNLPLYSLKAYLISTRHNSNLHVANMFEKDYESNYSFPYNVTKTDRISPTLNTYSIRFKPATRYTALGYLQKFTTYRIELAKTLDEGSKKVMITGDPGTGKTSIVKNFFLAIQKGHGPASLKFNRVVSLDISNIVSTGAKGPEILSSCLKEFSNLKSTILLLDNIHILFSVSGLDYVSILTPYLEDPKLKIICTADTSTYRSFSKNYTGVDALFRKLNVEEITGKEVYDFLVLKNWELHKKLTIPAIEFLVDSSSQILFDQHNPQKSLSLIEGASQKVTGKYLTKSVLSEHIKALTGISLGEITQNESDKLLHLEESIKKEVVGQKEAVSEVANSLTRARGTRGTSNKPIASFLFAGPTGVGKTELAKSLARNYFGGEKNIIRLDMSEYQTPESINRLIGSEGGQNSGILTQHVKETPFNLILLDEIEKASPNIHMLFLQVRIMSSRD